MTLQAFNGNWWPNPLPYAGVLNAALGAGVTGTAGTLDAATEKVAFMGILSCAGATGKVLSAAGGGNIQLRTGAVTWAGATTLRVGLQDVSTAAGPAVQPDGTFDVSRDWVRGVDALSANTWTTFSMTGGSGSKTVSDGDLIAVVVDMIARGGTDSVIITGWSTSVAQAIPGVNTNIAGAWGTSPLAFNPNCVITFDDGTFGTLLDTIPVTTVANQSFNSGSAPNEYCMIFQVPMPCRINAIRLLNFSASGTADGTLSLYSSPLGTPSVMASTTYRGRWANTTSNRWTTFYLGAQTLAANTDYAIGLRATTAGNLTLPLFTLANSNHKSCFPGGTNVRAATRSGGAGALTVVGTSYFLMDARFSAFDDGTGGGSGGMLVHPGMGGGLRG